MNDYDGNEDFGSYVRGRAYTWSHEPRSTRGSKRGGISSDDYEQDAIMRNLQSEDCAFETEDAIELQRQTQMVTGKKRRKSYTEIIATAILSSAEKRLTLAEIYDWMAANVEEYKNQRYVPSSSSWKNAVRHNLSVQSCFKRVKRHGVEKPSWWTVDIRQAAKRRLSIPLFTDGKSGMDIETHAPQKRTQAAASEDQSTIIKGKGVSFDSYVEDGDGNGESAEHGYSRNLQQLMEGQPNKMDVDSVIAYDINGQSIAINGQSIATLNLDGDQPSISAEQLAQAWLNRFKTSGAGLVGKNGSTIQTVRVKTAHGVEQNVRFAGPLRINVVVRCEKAAQTDDLDDGGLMKTAGTNYPTSPEFDALIRTCSIDQTLISFGNDCGVSKMLHGDVRMPSSVTADVLSPTAVLEEDALAACWNAISGDDLMTLTNMS